MTLSIGCTLAMPTKIMKLSQPTGKGRGDRLKQLQTNSIVICITYCHQYTCIQTVLRVAVLAFTIIHPTHGW